MGKNGIDRNSAKTKPVVITMNSEKVELIGDIEVDNESEALLPKRQGGISKKSDKPKRKVQWNDRNGNKLVEVKEFQPSEPSDSDDEDSDSCICAIM